MRTIWKFPIAIADVQVVLMPAGAKTLSVQFQGGTICLWALVDTGETTIPRKVYVFGTGHQIERGLNYIGSVQQLGGALVWHVFEE